MKNKLKEVSELLKRDLSLIARQNYRDAIVLIDVRFHFNQFVTPEATYIVGSAAGTALKRKPEPEAPVVPQVPVADMPLAQPLVQPAPMPVAFSQPLAAPMAAPMAMAPPLPAPMPAAAPMAMAPPLPAPMPAAAPAAFSQPLQSQNLARGGKSRKQRK